MSLRSKVMLVGLIVLLTAIPTAFAQTPGPRATPVAVAINPKIFDAYTGQYEDKANLIGTVFSFFREGDKFYLRVTNQDKIEIFPSSESKFFVKIFPAEMDFVRDTAGRGTGMIFRQGEQEFTTKRTADTPQVDSRVAYKRTEAMIPMRDGVKLDEILRGRYRRGWEKPEAIKSNKVLDYTIDLRGNDHVFGKGHRIMVEVQSTWFPLYDRNPQTFVNNIFMATGADFKLATQQIWRSAKYPSHVSVSFAKGN